jgi:hypothetical protein
MDCYRQVLDLFGELINGAVIIECSVLRTNIVYWCMCDVI